MSDTHHNGQMMVECPGCERNIRASGRRSRGKDCSPILCGGCNTSFEPEDNGA